MLRNTRLAPVIAHRGASASAPENSLSAISLAADQGATAVEIDVNISSDGIPYVHHDERLERCTTGSGLLHENESAHLDTVLASAGLAHFEKEPLPRLAAVIELILQRGISLNLEIKPPQGRAKITTDAICAMLQDLWPESATIVLSSFDQDALKHAMHIAPELPRALLVGPIPDDWPVAMAAVGASNLHCSVKGFDALKTRALQEAGHRVYCYTANDDDTAVQLLDAGADGVFTDWPGRLLKTLKALDQSPPHA